MVLRAKKKDGSEKPFAMISPLDLYSAIRFLRSGAQIEILEGWQKVVQVSEDRIWRAPLSQRLHLANPK
jgi:hypothetical protein